MTRTWKIGLCLLAALLFGAYGLHLGSYFLTDLAYERLVASSPANRVQVEAQLPGFEGVLIFDPREMHRLLRDQVLEGRQYWRYTRWGDRAIDVVYEPGGEIQALWPKYH